MHNFTPEIILAGGISIIPSHGSFMAASDSLPRQAVSNDTSGLMAAWLRSEFADSKTGVPGIPRKIAIEMRNIYIHFMSDFPAMFDFQMSILKDILAN